MFLGLVILLAPVLYHAFRIDLFPAFSLKKLGRAVDQSILIQGGLALVAIYPLMLAGFAGMGGRQFHPLLDLVVKALFYFEYLFWGCYAPAVVIFKLIRLVADRMEKRRDMAS